MSTIQSHTWVQYDPIVDQIRIPVPDREPDFELVGYLRRWYLFKRHQDTPHLYLHNIISGDEHVMHDHPWDFHIHILSGGYWEMTPDGMNQRSVGDFFFKRAEDQHFIIDVFPDTWTLIQCSPKRREWGAWPNGVFVPHYEYNSPGRDHIVIKRVKDGISEE